MWEINRGNYCWYGSPLTNYNSLIVNRDYNTPTKTLRQTPCKKTLSIKKTTSKSCDIIL